MAPGLNPQSLGTSASNMLRLSNMLRPSNMLNAIALLSYFVDLVQPLSFVRLSTCFVKSPTFLKRGLQTEGTVGLAISSTSSVRYSLGGNLSLYLHDFSLVN